MTTTRVAPAGERMTVRGIELQVLRRGAGRPLLLLHGPHPVDPRAPFVDLLARHAEIIAPSHPGFGHSARPDGFDTVYDLVHLYLDLLDRLPRGPVTLVGLSFGGWLAAEIAVTCSHRLDTLVLVDAVGIKRPRDARCPRRLQHVAPGSSAAELARSRPVGAGLRRDVG
jgi:pimeloyl-ACP methyl ester carboxylesterase